MAAVIFIALGLSVSVVARLVRPRHPEDPLVQVQEDLTRAQEALADALTRATQVAGGLIEKSKRQQQELAALQSRYDALKALAAGQEDLARAYRRILTERSLGDRIVDLVIGFLVGVGSSFVASLVLAWAASKRTARGASGPSSP